MDGLSWFKTEHESLPSLLIKEGYNVFLANGRGTKNSQRHQTLHPVHNARQFFDFSLKEIGAHDIPAFMNISKEKSNGLPVIFIGYAESATAMLHQLGTGEFREKQILKSLASDIVLLAPCVYLEPARIWSEEQSKYLDISDMMYKGYETVYDFYS